MNKKEIIKKIKEAWKEQEKYEIKRRKKIEEVLSYLTKTDLKNLLNDELMEIEQYEI